VRLDGPGAGYENGRQFIGFLQQLGEVLGILLVFALPDELRIEGGLAGERTTGGASSS